MFWDAVQATFVILTYWQIYAAGLEYVIIVFTPILIAYLVSSRGGSGHIIKYTSVILVPIFQAVGTLFFVFSVAQIALGQAHHSTWKVPIRLAFEFPGEFLKLSIYIILTSILLAILPIINRLFALQTLVLGGLTLMMMFALYADGDDLLVYSEIDWLPGFWFVIGIVIVGAIFGTIGVVLVSIFPQFLRALTGRDMDGISVLISIPIASTFGFVPFFIYAAWIGTQIG